MTITAEPKGPRRPAITLPLAPPPGRPLRVAIVTGSYGAGHNAASREIARTLTDAGCVVETYDVVDLMRLGMGRVLQTGYSRQLREQPRSWETTLRMLEPGKPGHYAVTRLLRFLSTVRVAEAVRGFDLAIATQPFAAQALGAARRSGRVDVPVVTYLTDASVPSIWIHPSVDLHVAIHDVAAAEARTLRAGETRTIRPLVTPAAVDCHAVTREDPLASYGIIGPRALLTAGALGIGDLEAAARDIAETGLITPVVVCGTNGGLRDRLAGTPGVIALGWRDDLLDLIATSDVIVQNAGGFTSLEALASGVPVITYRPLPGHGRTNCLNLDRAGLVPWARNQEDLVRLLKWALDAPR
ncbi:MAG: glycosyltransferase, partial [Nocardioides sp.]|nr:glycosyltransferase [Nocardioides sp.]